MLYVNIYSPTFKLAWNEGLFENDSGKQKYCVTYK